MPRGQKQERYCYICKQFRDAYEKTNMKQHQINIHLENIKKIKQSNNTEDGVRTTCKICSAHVKVTQLRGHTRSKHKMTITEYKKEYNQGREYYDLVELILHRCGICEEYLVLDNDYIAAHLKSRNANGVSHNFTHANYNSKFMILDAARSSASRVKNEKRFSEGWVKENIQNIQQSSDLGKTTLIPIHVKETTNDDHSFQVSKEDECCEFKADDITLEGFHALLDLISVDGENLRYPVLDALLLLNID